MKVPDLGEMLDGATEKANAEIAECEKFDRALLSALGRILHLLRLYNPVGRHEVSYSQFKTAIVEGVGTSPLARHIIEYEDDRHRINPEGLFEIVECEYKRVYGLPRERRKPFEDGDEIGYRTRYLINLVAELERRWDQRVNG